MKIQFTHKIALTLETICNDTHDLEFSGLGFVKTDIAHNKFVVYDFALLSIGSEVFTQIDPRNILPLMDRSDVANLKAWIHRHPVGNGRPGSHNWSNTDNTTIRETPLGSPPQFVRWALAVVRTPGGWVGRVDRYLPKQETVHLKVYPQLSVSEHQKITKMIPQPTRGWLPAPVPDWEDAYGWQRSQTNIGVWQGPYDKWAGEQ